MLKQIISLLAIIALSAAVVFFMPEAQKAIQALVSAHDWISDILTNVFNGGNAGNIARELVALLIIPLLAGLIPGILFFALRKYWLPCFMEIVWIVWLLQAGALLMVYVYPATTETPSTATAPAAAPEKESATPPKTEPEPAAPANPAAIE